MFQWFHFDLGIGANEEQLTEKFDGSKINLRHLKVYTQKLLTFAQSYNFQCFPMIESQHPGRLRVTEYYFCTNHFGDRKNLLFFSFSSYNIFTSRFFSFNFRLQMKFNFFLTYQMPKLNPAKRFQNSPARRKEIDYLLFIWNRTEKKNQVHHIHICASYKL